MSGVREVVERHVAAFNERRSAEEAWADGVELEEPGGRFEAREDVLARLDVVQTAFADASLTVRGMVVEGDEAALEGIFHGTHEGPLALASGEVEPTARNVSFRWAAVVRVEDDALAVVHAFFDVADVRGQLGLG